MRPYLIHFAQMHADFRLAELEALSQLEKIPIEYDRGTYRADNPFLLVRLADDDSARRLVRRSILIKEVCEFWAQGSDYPELFAVVKQTPERWVSYAGLGRALVISDGVGPTRRPVPISRPSLRHKDLVYLLASGLRIERTSHF
ncbi:hypothetical protein IWQ60_008901 [Tieghemiomyces parasiticus]|uniref:tRNA (guanine(10)-N(2))-methyltransferase TRMT11 N-terminal domain-containing protein n=1 Tax=Tieghemiomyces parasiticus TaxID=78921 RepID=A0A9W7ZQ25_9FUNG|nr:hypothetical protein IWQ60_008901 [Tieghemiomyces parasiticus]